MRHVFTFSFLPIAHILERIAIILITYVGGKIVFASNSFANFKSDCSIAHSTGGSMIPFVFNKMHQSILEAFQDIKPIFDFCLTLTRVCRFFGFRSKLADAIAFQRVKQTMGGYLKWFIIAGDAFDKDIHQNLADILELEIIPIYGISECGGPVTVAPRGIGRPGTVGLVPPGIDVTVSSTNEVLIKTPLIFSNYWKRDSLSQERFLDGWYLSGDKGSVDDDGFFSILGREQDMFESESGDELALPFLRFSYREYDLCDDIFIYPLRDLKKLIAIVVVRRDLDSIIYSKKFEDDQFEQFIRSKNFIQWLLQEFQNFYKDKRFKEGSEISNLRAISQPFRVEDGTVSTTGKQRTIVLAEMFSKEIEEMINELTNN